MNDPYWDRMWYLNRGFNLDMNVEQAWAEGVTGKGVNGTMLDDGKSLISNFFWLASKLK